MFHDGSTCFLRLDNGFTWDLRVQHCAETDISSGNISKFTE